MGTQSCSGSAVDQGETLNVPKCVGLKFRETHREMRSEMAAVIGTHKADTLSGAATSSNTIVGRAGNDVLTAGKAGDTLIGDGSAGGAVNMAKMTITEAVTAKVQFDGSGAGYHNTVGMYTYDNAGNITSTKLLFNDVSAGGVAGGPAAFEMALQAGQHIGFFVAPNAAGQTDIKSLAADGVTFHLVNTANGAPANVKSGEPMQIAYETQDHQWGVVHTQYWTDI